MFSLKKRRLLGGLIAVFLYLKGTYKRDDSAQTGNDRTKRNGFKLKEEIIRLQIRRKFCTQRVVRLWRMLPGEVVNAPS